MSQAVHLAKNLPGYGSPDGRCLPFSGICGQAVAISSCSSRGHLRFHSHNKIGTMICVSGGAAFVCKASSGHYRRNPDFSRHRRNGLRGRNRQNEERDSFEDDPELLSSKNGPLLSLSNSPKYQATATPGPREKEIVELFRKVQAQLRERAATKENKKVETSQGQHKESETVDSLLKLLRKHSVEQSKRKSSGSSNSNHTEFYDSYDEDRSRSFFDSNRKARPDPQEPNVSSLGRPASNFRRKSPVTQFKYQPSYSTKDTVNSISFMNSSGTRRKSSVEIHTEPNHKLEPEPEVELEIEPEPELEGELESSLQDRDYDEQLEGESNIMGGAIYEEVLDGESLDVGNGDNDEEKEERKENEYLSSMKLRELRALAKSRSVKGFSKMKKGELIELLSGASSVSLGANNGK